MKKEKKYAYLLIIKGGDKTTEDTFPTLEGLITACKSGLNVPEDVEIKTLGGLRRMFNARGLGMKLKVRKFRV